MSKRYTLLYMLLLCFLTACGTPVVERVNGSVTVLDRGDNWQVVSVEAEATAIALYVTPPYTWVDGQCYSIGYIDPQTESDGSPTGEPRALNVAECPE